MASNLAKAAVGAMALNGGSDVPTEKPLINPAAKAQADVPNDVPKCPGARLPKFHDEESCMRKPSRPAKGHQERNMIYEQLKHSGSGATLVPNQQTVVCPMQVESLENPSAIKGFDTTWIVENTATTSVVISWLVNGVEWSPFTPDAKPMDDPKAILKPGDWTSVPTFESFVYHVREVDAETGSAGQILMQHRAGLVPIGNPNQVACDIASPDVEPVSPQTAERQKDFERTPTHEFRPCNVIDLGFRNQVGCPLHVYWASHLADIPTEGFSCGEEFKFHLGTKPAPQDFMNDWESSTKFEGSFVGHTFVARLASNPNVVVDSYTLESTKIVDCPNLKQHVGVASRAEAEVVISAEGTTEQATPDHVAAAILPHIDGVSH